MNTQNTLFPHFQRFVEASHLDRAKGSLSAKLPRILGQGTTRATGLTDPPAVIERKMELAGLEFPAQPVVPEQVQSEVRAASADVEALRTELKRPDGLRRFIADSLRELAVETGSSNGYHFAGRLILRSSKSGFEWAWCVTPHYAIVERIPPDPHYVGKAFRAAQEKIKALVVEPADFEKKLSLAWTMARAWSKSDDVLVTDVMKMYQIAGQEDKFWQSPKRVHYKDLPDAAFVVNLINWRSHSGINGAGFTFVPATLSQASGKRASVFFLPLNAEGTEVRPMIHLRRSS
jgi:hypothetical protein